MPGLVGMLLFGFLVDRLTRKGPQWLLLLAACALFSATGMILAVTWAPSLGAAQIMAIPSGLLGGGWSIGIMAALQYVLPDRFRATGTALGLLVINLIGYVLGPLLAGQLSDLVAGTGATSLRIALSFVIPVGFIGALLMWLGGRSIESDRARLA